MWKPSDGRACTRAVAQVLVALLVARGGMVEDAMTEERRADPARKRCKNFSPPTWTGRWRDWHRGHGCHLDPTPSESATSDPARIQAVDEGKATALDASPPVHDISYASQPDIVFRCTGKSTTPAWGKSKTERPSVYLAESGDLYSFEPELVTCAACLAYKRKGAVPSRVEVGDSNQHRRGER